MDSDSGLENPQSGILLCFLTTSNICSDYMNIKTYKFNGKGNIPETKLAVLYITTIYRFQIKCNFLSMIILLVKNSVFDIHPHSSLMPIMALDHSVLSLFMTLPWIGDCKQRKSINKSRTEAYMFIRDLSDFQKLNSEERKWQGTN